MNIKEFAIHRHSLYSEFSGNAGMKKTKIKEWPKFCEELIDYKEEFKDMFDYLDKVYTL